MKDKKLTKGASLHVMGEGLVEALKLPKDAKIFKILPVNQGSYTFEVLYFSDDGYELHEGCIFPRATVERRNIIK